MEIHKKNRRDHCMKEVIMGSEKKDGKQEEKENERDMLEFSVFPLTI